MAATDGRVDVATASGDVDRTCRTCGVEDDRPMHIVLGASTEPVAVTTDDNRRLIVNMPVDEAHHIECHSCESCNDPETLTKAKRAATRASH